MAIEERPPSKHRNQHHDCYNQGDRDRRSSAILRGFPSSPSPNQLRNHTAIDSESGQLYHSP